MFAACLLAASVVAADPTPDQLTLLKVFRGEFVAITPGEGRFPGTFRMGRAGDAEPVHEVTMGYRFQIARYEVPQNLWGAVMGSNPSRWKGPRNSVEMLSFDEAQEFCRKVTDLLRSARLIEPDEEVRLPSEAEWEYCTRAGTNTVYSFGDDRRQLGDYGWSTENAKGNDPPVGAKKPNAWGLYDVHGYLWEWCGDIWHERYAGAPGDGSAWVQPGDPAIRVLRGGSWKDAADRLTSSSRAAAPAGLRDDAVGLRCVLASVPRK
ncbi:MAG: formylglycine-generating enzyme family protein [Pirellulaceae bacterium]